MSDWNGSGRSGECFDTPPILPIRKIDDLDRVPRPVVTMSFVSHVWSGDHIDPSSFGDHSLLR